MSLRPVLLSTTLIASLPLAGYADVTPEDVWADQVAAIEAMGMTIDAREARSGDTLRISDVVMSSSMDMGMIESLITIRIPAIDIAEAGGGEVDMSLEGAIVYEVATPDVEEIDMSGFTSITTAQFDGKIRVSGNPDDMVYTFDNAAASMTTDEVVIEEMTVQPAVDVAIAPISGQYTSRRSTDKHEIDYAFEAGEVAYMVQPSSYGEQSVTLDATINDLTSSASMTLDRSETPTDMMTALLIGGALTAQQDFAGSTFAFEMVDGETGAETQARGQTGAAKTSVTMSNGVIGYDVSASGLSVSISGSQIPFPTIDLAMARTGVSFQAPMVGTGICSRLGSVSNWRSWYCRTWSG